SPTRTARGRYRHRGRPGSEPLRPVSTAASESLCDPLQPTTANRDYVEGHPQTTGFGMPGEPALCGAAHTPLLLLVHHLERMAEPLAGLLLDLAEHQPATAAGDDVELVTPGPGVLRQDPITVQAVPPAGAALGAETLTGHVSQATSRFVAPSSRIGHGTQHRSEERRVGEEGSSGLATEHGKQEW